MVDTLQRHVWRRGAAARRVATILETLLPKKGTRTPGVELQRCGAAAGRATASFSAPRVLRRRFPLPARTTPSILPRTWTDSPERREARGSRGREAPHEAPAARSTCFDHGGRERLRFGWVTCGIEYSSDAQFLKELEGRGYRYVAAAAGAAGRRALLRRRRPLDSRSRRRRRRRTGFPDCPRGGKTFRRPSTSGARRSASTTSRCGPTGPLLRHLALSAASLLFLEERVRRSSASRKERPAVNRGLSRPRGGLERVHAVWMDSIPTSRYVPGAVCSSEVVGIRLAFPAGGFPSGTGGYNSGRREERRWKKVEAVIKPFKLDEVKNARSHIGVQGLTVSEVRGFAAQKGHKEQYRGAEYTWTSFPRCCSRSSVADGAVPSVVEAITRAARYRRDRRRQDLRPRSGGRHPDPHGGEGGVRRLTAFPLARATTV
jgi:nitrogen regulatory protein P-II 1